MNLKLETEFSKADILQEVDALKKEIDDMRPLPADVEGKVMQKLRLDWNYHSNAIEGNKLSFGETVAFLMEGITAKGKPLKDHLDIRGHNEAINFLLSIVKDTRPISEADIRALHKMILVEPYNVKAQTADGIPTTKHIALGEYKTSANHVQTATGETHYYATPEDTPAKMQELMEWYAAVSANPDIHPVVAAALFHHKFVSIHPFDDGNGRLSRILMNLILMQKGYPPVVIKLDDRQNYYALLSRADNGDGWPFVAYISERLINSLQLFLKAVQGGDIDEDEDIDKELELLRIQFNSTVTIKEKKSVSAINRVFIDSIHPLAEKIFNKLRGFQTYFFKNEHFFQFEYVDMFGPVKSSKRDNNNSLDSYKEAMTDHLSEIDISIHFGEYKNLQNMFDLYLFTKFRLHEFYYDVSVNEKVLLTKHYHDSLTSTDENLIIKEVVKNLKDQLVINQKSPKS
jgi:Fic family protein